MLGSAFASIEPFRWTANVKWRSWCERIIPQLKRAWLVTNGAKFDRLNNRT